MSGRAAALLLGLLACNAPAADAAAAPSPPASGSAPAPGPALARLPMRDTPADQLTTAALRHTELLRIERDFGKPSFAVVLDAWVPAADPTRLADVRLWWLKKHRANARGPFGTKSRRHFDLHTRKVSPTHWQLHMDAGAKRFTFDVRLAAGRPVATATVALPGGAVVADCRAEHGTLKARRVLGVPAGIEALELTCRAPGGRRVTGTVVPTRP